MNADTNTAKRTRPPGHRFGRGGEVHALARLGRQSALLRMAALVAAEKTTDDMAVVDACRLLLSDGRKVPKTDQIAALQRLRTLVEDEATTDAAALRAAQTVLMLADGRRPGRAA